LLSSTSIGMSNTQDDGQCPEEPLGDETGRLFFNLSLVNHLLLEVVCPLVVALAVAPSHIPVIVSGEIDMTKTTPMHQGHIYWIKLQRQSH
jgi:hypothetical protein